jgi:ATP-dependent helicase HrpA
MFIDHALVREERLRGLEDDPLERTRHRIAQIEELATRARRTDLHAGDDAIAAFYESRIPGSITGGRAFDRWWARTRRAHPGLLDIPLEVLLNPARAPLDASEYPTRWVHHGLELSVSYKYEPGSADDGVTVEVPLPALNRLDPEEFRWQVPGRRTELVAEMIRSLPRSIRSKLPPPTEAAREVVAGVGPRDGPIEMAVAERLSALAGEPVPTGAWDRMTLPDHLKVRFEVVDDDGRHVASGRDLDRLRDSLAEQVKAALRNLAPEIERHGRLQWDFPDLPREVVRGFARGYPALVDEGSAVGVTVVDSPSEQARSMWEGTRRLILIGAPLPYRHIQRTLTLETRLAVSQWGVAIADLLDDCATAVVEQIVVASGGPAFDEEGFAAMLARARSQLPDRVSRLATIAGGVLAAAQGVLAKAARLEAIDTAGRCADAVSDTRRQVRRLVPTGFVSSAGPARLRDLLRYLEAASRRLDLLPNDIRRDRQRQSAVHTLQSRYDALLERLAAGTLHPSASPEVSSVRWMIEELRVSLWAQSLGTSESVSDERISRTLARLGA